MSKNKASAAASAAMAVLAASLPIGSKVTPIVRYESANGLSRVVQFLAIVNGAITDMSAEVGAVLGWRNHAKYPGVVVQGLNYSPVVVVETLSDVVHTDRTALSADPL